MNRDREHLREWLAFVDRTCTEEDWLKFVSASLKQFASTESFTAGIREGG